MNPSEPLRLAVIGAGKWATDYHFPALRALESEGVVEIRGIWNRTESKARSAVSDFAIARVYSSLSELADDPETDGFVVLVNPKILPEIIDQILHRGLPIFTEKSPGWTGEEARQLAEVVGVTNVVGFNRRYMPLNQRFKEMVDTMNQPFFVECHFYRHRRLCPEFIVETGVHGINYLEYLLGPLISVETDRQKNRTSDTYSWICRFAFASGIRGIAKFFPCSGSSVERYEVHDDNVSVFLESPQTYSSDFPGRIILHEGGKVKEIIPAEEGRDAAYHAGFLAEHREFATAVRVGGDTRSNFANAATTMEIAGTVERGADYTATPETPLPTGAAG